MQDLHSIGVGGGGGGGGGGRFFGGGGLDRRMRVHGHLAQQALKCPRCDSLNTKFCYYNNYNLSQPRHFCKACRRYWTKGGVLRSVPVGGGCRKTKRSKSRSSAGDGSRERKSKAQSPSSTDSSSLTAATPSIAVAEERSALSVAATESATKFGFSGAIFYNSNPPANLSFDDHGREQLINTSGSTDCQIFPEIGSFDGLMGSSDNAASMVGFSMADVPTTSYDRMQRQAPTGAGNPGPELDEFKMQDMNSDGLTAALDWGSCGGGDQSLFDLTAALDPSYWSQPQWTDSDHSLPYLP